MATESTTIGNERSASDVDIRAYLRMVVEMKNWIIGGGLFGVIVAFFIIYSSQQWWSSWGKIVPPTISDYSSFYKEGESLRQVMDVRSERLSQNRSKLIEDLIGSGEIFNKFIFALSSEDSKRLYLQSSQIFKAYLEENGIASESDIKAEEEKWLRKIVIVKARSVLNPAAYEVGFQATSGLQSMSMLTEYLQFVSDLVEIGLWRDLQLLKVITQAEFLKEREILLEIRQEIGGKSKRISEEVERVAIGLKLLQKMELNEKNSISIFRFSEDLRAPLTPDKPIKSIIFGFCLFLGGSVGVVTGLISRVVKFGR